MAPNLPSIYLKVYSKYIAIRRIRPRESINSRICNDTTDCQTHNKGTDHRLAANVMWTDSLVSCVVTYSTIDKIVSQDCPTRPSVHLVLCQVDRPRVIDDIRFYCLGRELVVSPPAKQKLNI